MTRKRFYVWACIVCMLPASLWADETIYSAAGRQDPMDNLGGGVRAIAMGSAFVAVSDDASAVFWNPAGLSSLRQQELSFQHSDWFGAGRENLFYGLPIPKFGGVGFSGSYTGYGSFDGRDALGVLNGTYGANQIDMGAGWGGRVAGALSVGAQINGIQQILAEKSYSLFTASLGAMISTAGGWRVGLSYMNWGLSHDSALAAASFRAGLSKSWRIAKSWGVLTAVSGNLSPQSDNSFQCGLEADYESKYLLRLGYDYHMQKSGFDGLYGPTAGLGLALGPMRLDYAFIPYGDMGSSHQFGLSYHFGNRSPEEASLKSSVSSVVVAPSPVTVFVQVPVAPTATSVTPRAVEGPVGVDGGALVMDFEESSEGLSSARAFVKEDRMAEAVKAYVDWLSKNPRDAQAWWELGGLYYQLGKKEYAVKCFESVLTLKPGNKNLSAWLEKNRNRP